MDRSINFVFYPYDSSASSLFEWKGVSSFVSDSVRTRKEEKNSLYIVNG